MIYTIGVYLFYFLYSLFWRHKIIGKEVFSSLKQGAIIASNHLSYLDPPLVAISVPKPVYFLAKHELFKSALQNWLFRAAHSFPVSGGIRDKDSLIESVKILKNNGCLTIFPEGRRSLDGKLCPFQKGVGMLAYRLRCPIIPTYIHGTYEILPVHKTLPRPFKKTLLVFGSPIYWQEEWDTLTKKECIAAITKRVEEAIHELAKKYGS